jgi:predicted homoserine dehydrogenase-like protein
MYLYSALQERERDGNPIRVCLVGAGKFGSMFLNQIITTPGLEITSIADLNPHNAKLTCKTVG